MASTLQLLAEAKRIAVAYYERTGRPLGITGEVAEYEATRLLGLELAEVRSPGYDAIEQTPDGPMRVQIKGRRRTSPSATWGRMGSVDLSKVFDTVMLVLLGENYDTVEILEADAESVRARLTAPGSRARNERGSMAVAQFRSIAKLRWPPPEGRR
ncbi:MAG: hypothetical protein O2895_04775 [Chloroflexi bacterium]|nr:hypothetical protein [Chloroflexota bacterium]